MNPIFSSAASIEIKASSSAKALIERAAAAQGMTVSDFAAAVLTEKSREVLQASEGAGETYSPPDSRTELLQSPPAPNAETSESSPRFRYAAQPLDLLV